MILILFALDKLVTFYVQDILEISIEKEKNFFII